ncbi:hypothetical protein QJS10_CPB20g00568 [Acorus calamus]|uniref:Uncharacterized protein n=1 Tax=Acorus calamus TaxID=4465 RepID=A0AAV9CDF5_ACOCL|nr:hypothetical protein QJS10_CPB20g00568 [Acorus calamus]
MVKVCTRGRSRTPSLVSLSLWGLSWAWSWSIPVMEFMRGASCLSVDECKAVNNPLMYVLVIVYVTHVIVF